jgi:uncharacterized protein Yka (UPF0111/DUF47 family)
VASMGFKEWIIPQEKVFFDHFEQEADKLVEAAALLKEFSKNFEDRKGFMKRIHKVENECDDIVHNIYRELDKTFITPFDREDISGLAGKLDDVIDYIDAAVKRAYLYDIREKPCYFGKFAKLIHKGTVEVKKAVYGLRNLKDIKAIENACIKVNELENDGDDLLTMCLKRLFKSDDVKLIIREKELYDFLEMTTDKLEEVAFLIMDIVLKNS